MFSYFFSYPPKKLAMFDFSGASHRGVVVIVRMEADALRPNGAK